MKNSFLKKIERQKDSKKVKEKEAFLNHHQDLLQKAKRKIKEKSMKITKLQRKRKDREIVHHHHQSRAKSYQKKIKKIEIGQERKKKRKSKIKIGKQ